MSHENSHDSPAFHPAPAKGRKDKRTRGAAIQRGKGETSKTGPPPSPPTGIYGVVSLFWLATLSATTSLAGLAGLVGGDEVPYESLWTVGWYAGIWASVVMSTISVLWVKNGFFDQRPSWGSFVAFAVTAVAVSIPGSLISLIWIFSGTSPQLGVVAGLLLTVVSLSSFTLSYRMGVGFAISSLVSVLAAAVGYVVWLSFVFEHGIALSKFSMFIFLPVAMVYTLSLLSVPVAILGWRAERRAARASP